MADLLALSTKVIDSGVVDGPVNRTSGELSEVADGLAMVESFSHTVAWDSGEGLVCFDASHYNSGSQIVSELARWRPGRIHTLVYTHGHIDHVGGSGAFAAHNRDNGHAPLRVVGHENVQRRFDRYRATDAWNQLINARQFGGVRDDLGMVNDLRPASGGGRLGFFLPPDTADVTDVVGDFTVDSIGGTTLEFHHGKGETDDHLWTWFPGKKWVATGDFVIWNFPNAGNPQKVQRWPIEWAATLRRIIAKEPELLLPAHGLPIAGRERIARVLDEIATALENLVRDVLGMMNAGATLDEIVHTVRVPADTLAKPYLRPLYDEPEFVVRGVWRQFGGWWDGAASRLKPAPDAAVGSEIAALAGGADVLVRRAHEIALAGDLRLACHLADLAGWAEPSDPEIHEVRAAIYEMRRKSESSLMAKGIFKGAARESEAVVKRAQES
ncbi:MAG: alkyl sulfatase dimerization domain-containing protein [Ilumatobacteraceae bacterium]